MIHEYRSTGAVHRVHRWGAPATVGFIGTAFFLAMTPHGETVKQGLAWVGRVLKPFY
jgi:hypothetical protein